ncbi:hypothetical protein [uncultured Paraglaciecola sp.]|uniref:hypothetical protein n=1 Tax=uncultured Paraglaciecola sp. TaxID=1765024 RepID=UPI002598240C|nr:hypothetical protein [uncultured Paraglaciecola sp.]
MKKLYIHIGPHKTGSTYIQKNLFECSQELLTAGIFYPERLVGPQWGHHQLAEKIKQRNKKEIEDLLSSKEDNLLISSENFEDLTNEDISYFSCFLKGFSVEVVFFKRSYSKLLVSAWQESVKHGKFQTWSEFFLAHVLKPFKSQILNSSSVVDKWSVIADKIHVFDYEAMLSDGLDIAQSMCEKVLGVNISVKPAAINQSMHLADIEVIRMLNYRYAQKTNSPPRTFVRDAYLKLKLLKDESVGLAFETVKSNLVKESLDDSWTINFFEKKFSYKDNMYFAKDTASTNICFLPSANTSLDRDFINSLAAIEKKLDV